jgi:hypothetical protein
MQCELDPANLILEAVPITPSKRVSPSQQPPDLVVIPQVLSQRGLDYHQAESCPMRTCDIETFV